MVGKADAFPNFGKSITQYIFEKAKIAACGTRKYRSFLLASHFIPRTQIYPHHLRPTRLSHLKPLNGLPVYMRVARFGCAFLARELNGAVTHKFGNDHVVAAGVAAVDRVRCSSDSGSVRCRPPSPLA